MLVKFGQGWSKQLVTVGCFGHLTICDKFGQVHHVETSNTYTGYRALFKVLTNHRASHLHTFAYI